MNPIRWPKTRYPALPPTQDSDSLPPLELDKSDYEAANEAFRQLDDSFFEVVFLKEVAARHCRERQLKAALSRGKTTLSFDRAYNSKIK
ncbi:MAG TPA: hypothetical protein VNU92_18320 [Edaphobacter sp.]|nr:hypothetical protein [Edaphobacter sp.]